MAEAVNPILRLYSDTYNAQGYSSEEHLANGQLQQSTLLSGVITNLFYSSKEFGKKSFPILFSTEGMGKKRAIKTIDYDAYVMGKAKKTSSVGKALYSASATPGKGYATFVIPFADRWFMKSMNIMSSNHRIQARVIEDPIQDGDVWLYKVKLVTPSADAYCPVEYLAAGQKWSQGITKVGTFSSEGVESRSQSPGKVKNQLSIVRDSYKYKGNIQNKVMVVEIKTDKGATKYWCDVEMFQQTLAWKEKCETDLWYSLYNSPENGEIQDMDIDGQSPVPQGSGIVEQIPNEDTYSYMTTTKLTQIVRDALYNASDSYQRNIKVYTGIGGMAEADKAMKDASANSGFTFDRGIEVKGSDRNLSYGSYFTKFNHIDGGSVEFVLSSIFDEGPKAQASARHPESGLPMESYSMYFLDESNYDGQNNIEYIYEEGRGDLNWIVPGATIPKGYPQSLIRASGRDESSIHWMKSQGVHIYRPTNCFKVYCNLT